MIAKQAMVWSADGQKTKIWSMPTRHCEEYWHIPNWTHVIVKSVDNNWAQISIGAFVGYIKTERLLFGGDAYENNSRTMRQH